MSKFDTMISKEVPTLEEIVEALVELRVSRDLAEQAFWIALYKAEQKLSDLLINRYHFDSFDQFIESHIVTDAKWYRTNYPGIRAAIQVAGEDTIEEIGLQAARHVGRIPEENREAYVAVMAGWVKDHGGVKPSKGTSSSAARNFGMPVVSKAVSSQKRVMQLEEEVKALKAQNRKLKQENARLKKDIVKLEGGSEEDAA